MAASADSILKVGSLASREAGALVQQYWQDRIDPDDAELRLLGIFEHAYLTAHDRDGTVTIDEAADLCAQVLQYIEDNRPQEG
jgi:hypothetical protein